MLALFLFISDRNYWFALWNFFKSPMKANILLNARPYDSYWTVICQVLIIETGSSSHSGNAFATCDSWCSWFWPCLGTAGVVIESVLTVYRAVWVIGLCILRHRTVTWVLRVFFMRLTFSTWLFLVEPLPIVMYYVVWLLHDWSMSVWYWSTTNVAVYC